MDTDCTDYFEGKAAIPAATLDWDSGLRRGNIGRERISEATFSVMGKEALFES